MGAATANFAAEHIDEALLQRFAILHKARVSGRQIAAELGISRQRVSKLKKQIEQSLKMDAEDSPFGFDSGLLPTMTRAEAVKKLVELSTRPEGLRNSEMQPVLAGLFGFKVAETTGGVKLAMSADQLQYLKACTRKAAAKREQAALFVPDWLPRRNPVEANRLLISLAGELHDAAQEKVAHYLALFPDTTSYRVAQELVSLSFRQASSEPVETRCARNSKAAEELQERLGVSEPMQANCEVTHVPNDHELDALCI